MVCIRVLGAVLLAMSLIGGRHSLAQDGAASYPNKPVRMVVPFAAGGLPDVMARVIARRLTELLGQQFIVDNRPGAGGIIGCEVVAKSPPDGYTLLVADVGQWAINPAIYSKLPYDPVKDFAPVGRMGTTSLFMIVDARVPIATFADFMAVANSMQGKMNYGSSGIGSIHHLIFETLKAQTGVKLTHVPYKGSGQVVPALLGGEVSVMLAALPTVEAHIKSGQMKVLAIAATKRASQAPGVPTFAELGVPGIEFPVDIGILAPAGTPTFIVSKLSTGIRMAVTHPDTVQRFAAGGINPVSDSPESYATVIKTDIEKYARAAKISGAKVE